MWDQERLGRLAVSCMVAILGFIALHNACGIIPDIVIWWFLYCVGAGVMLNSEAGEPPRVLALLSMVPALVPVMMAGFFVLLEKPLCVSLPTPWVLLLLPIVSWLAIFVFTFSRAPMRGFVGFLIDPEAEENIRRAVSVLQAVVAGLIAFAIALLGLGSA